MSARAFVRFRLPDGTSRDLGSGDVVGRQPGAALHVNEPSISEVHALVSLRGSQLKLLALRGRLAVGGKHMSDVPLREGLRIVLGGALALVVEVVELPSEVLALEGDGVALAVLEGVSSLVLEPRALLVGHQPEADAFFWYRGSELWFRAAAGERRHVGAGAIIELGAARFSVVSVPLAFAARSPTESSVDAGPPLQLTLHYDSVHIHAERERLVVLDGIPARIVCELALIGSPIGWLEVARQIWRDEDDAGALRVRWDSGLARLRRRLREGKVRPDLVRASHNGLAELVLAPGDRVEDKT